MINKLSIIIGGKYVRVIIGAAGMAHMKYYNDDPMILIFEYNPLT